MWHLFYLFVVIPGIQGMWGSFWLFLLCHHSCLPNKWTHVPAALSPLYACDLGIAVLVLCLGNAVVLLFFCLSLQFHLWLWSHPRWPIGSSSFCTSASVDDQPQSMSFDSMSRCSSSIVAILISSTVMQSGMSAHDYYIDDNPHAGYFFISVSWLFLDSLSVISNCGPRLYSILMLDWWISSSTLNLKVSVIGLQHLSWK